MADGGESSGRDPRGRFGPGNPGGPGGSRKRMLALRRAAEEAITPEHIAAMVRKATRMGLEGDLTAMRLVFERTSGRAAEPPTEAEAFDIAMPRLKTAADCSTALERIIDGVCRGAIERESAQVLISGVQARLKALEMTELELRLEQLEQAAAVADRNTRT